MPIRTLALRAAALALASLAATPLAAQRAVVPWDDAARMQPGTERWGMVPLSREGSVEVSPDGGVWVAMWPHLMFRADSLRGDWQPRPATAQPTGRFWQYSLGQVERITFLDARHALATGHLRPERDTAARPGPRHGNDGLLYRTDDGGLTWSPVTLPDAPWIMHAQAGPDGQAWIGGFESPILHTADFGRSWRVLGHPFGGDEGVRTFWFGPGGTGIAGDANRMAVTDDGGRTWRTVPTPLAQDAYEDENHDNYTVDQVLGVPGAWIVEQGGRVFRTPRDRIRWTQLPGLSTVTREEETGTLFGMDTAGYLVRLEDGGPRRIASRPLHARLAGRLTARGGAVYARDENGGLYRADGTRETFANPLTSALPVQRAQLVAWDGTGLVGSVASSLLRSPDLGRTWHRVAWLPIEPRGLATRGDGAVLAWDGHANAFWVDPATGRVEEAAALRGWDVVEIVRTPGRWLAFGGMQDETARRVEVAQTFFAGQFDGTRRTGFVLASTDEGRTWTQVDDWKEGGVAALFPHADGSLSLYSYLGSVRRLTPAATGYAARNLVVATRRNADAVPYVQWVSAFHFDGAGRGVVEGTIHHVGRRRFASDDGGRTWRRVEDEPGMGEAWEAARTTLPLGGGRTAVARAGTADVTAPDGRVQKGVPLGAFLAMGRDSGYVVEPRTPSTVVLLDGTGVRTLLTLSGLQSPALLAWADDRHLLLTLDDGTHLRVPLDGSAPR